MPRGVLGLNAPMFKEYLRFIANRRCQQIGLDPLFDKARQPVPVDGGDDRSQEGEELLRDAGDRVSGRGGVELGLTSVAARPTIPDKRRRFRDLHASGCFVHPEPLGRRQRALPAKPRLRGARHDQLGLRLVAGPCRRRAHARRGRWRTCASSSPRPTCRSTPTSRAASRPMPQGVARKRRARRRHRRRRAVDRGLDRRCGRSRCTTSTSRSSAISRRARGHRPGGRRHAARRPRRDASSSVGPISPTRSPGSRRTRRPAPTASTRRASARREQIAAVVAAVAPKPVNLLVGSPSELTLAGHRRARRAARQRRRRARARGLGRLHARREDHRRARHDSTVSPAAPAAAISTRSSAPIPLVARLEALPQRQHLPQRARRELEPCPTRRSLGDESIPGDVHPVRQIGSMTHVRQPLGLEDGRVVAVASRGRDQQPVQALRVRKASDVMGEGIALPARQARMLFCLPRRSTSKASQRTSNTRRSVLISLASSPKLSRTNRYQCHAVS